MTGIIKNTVAALATAGLLASGSAQAALIDRGGGLIYDSVLNITWLQNANYAATQFAKTNGASGDADGRMNWSAANAWAAGLVYGGYSDWRLPTVSPVGAGFNYAFSNNGTTDIGTGISSPNSELAYMYSVNLGNLGLCKPNGNGSSTSCNEQTGWGLVNDPANVSDESLFVDLQSDVYWSGTAYAPLFSSNAWQFITRNGSQDRSDKSSEFFAWAVHTGDVAANAAEIPEPSSLALLGLGLIGMVVAPRRRPLGAA